LDMLRAPIRKEGTSHRPPAPFSKLSRKVTGQRRIRLFLDSNVLTGGILSPWGLDKATLWLCAAKVCRLVLAEVVAMKSKRTYFFMQNVCLPSMPTS
jgi:hypothetical protein